MLACCEKTSRSQTFAWLQRFRRGWGGDGAAALAHGLVHDDGSGDGDVERADAASHGYAEEVIAGAFDELVEAGAFAAEDEAGVLAEVEVGVVGCAAFVQADDPDVALFHGFEGAGEVDDFGDADMLGCPGGGLGDGSGEWCGAALGEEDAVDACAVGGAEERAEVVGVFDAVECQEEAITGGADGCVEEVFEREEFAFAEEGDDALVVVGAGVAGELVAGFRRDTDAGGAGGFEDAFETRVAAGFALAGDADVVDLSCSGAESLFDGVEAVQNIHLNSVSGGQRWREESARRSERGAMAVGEQVRDHVREKPSVDGDFFR